MIFGPFLFSAPLALLGLIALPVIWWILRATPPMPLEAELPSLRLLEGLDPRDETPARTPWWILALRLLAAALAIFGLAQPVYAPGANAPTGRGPVLIVIDDGWTAGPRWGELLDAARGHLTTLERDAPLHLLLTSPKPLPIDPAERLDRSDMSRRIASLEPVSWNVDRAGALARLQASGLRPTRIFWASDGLSPGDGTAFANALSDYGALTVFAAPPRAVTALTGLQSDATGVALTATRSQTSNDTAVFVSALSRDGAALATAPLTFEAERAEGVARFQLPPAALSRVQRFRVAGTRGAGSVWLWDSADRRARIGLVSDAEKSQPLLSDLHYVRQALTPFALISEGRLEDMIQSDPDTIILTDVGEIPQIEASALSQWVENGGTLIRFAGPRLAAHGDRLTPVPLRRTSRALGGALAWDTPQGLAPFSETSPFFGLTPPADARVRQQVLARPGPDLDQKTWARLADGSPIVTASDRGAGAIVLFHITAGPDWSDLPYAGVFVDMLRRAITAGAGRSAPEEGGVYAPQSVLSGSGDLVQPDDYATPLDYDLIDESATSPLHPPGFYVGPAGTRALNTAKGYKAQAITNWPASAILLGDAETVRLPLAGLAIGLSLLLVAIDLIVALATAGRLGGIWGRSGAGFAGLLLAFGISFVPSAKAQSPNINDILNAIEREQIRRPSNTSNVDGRLEAALELRFGYIPSGDRTLDETVEAGLKGLSRVLFRRTSVEPAAPDAVDLEVDPLELYPFLYFAVPDTSRPLTPLAIARLNTYLRSGGALVIDTREGGQRQGSGPDLGTLLDGVDIPPLMPAPDDHVITRSFYLIDSFPGRFANSRLWVERGGAGGDGVSGIFVGNADWAGAWAIDARGRALLSVDGGEEQREQARRFGVNLAMYVLTGNYKADQVHLSTLLERLGNEETAPLDSVEPEEQSR